MVTIYPYDEKRNTQYYKDSHDCRKTLRGSAAGPRKMLAVQVAGNLGILQIVDTVDSVINLIHRCPHPDPLVCNWNNSLVLSRLGHEYRFGIFKCINASHLSCSQFHKKSRNAERRGQCNKRHLEL